VIAATLPVQRPADARLLVVDPRGRIGHHPRAAFPTFLADGDTVVANDAATLPASLSGHHLPTGHVIEVRLAARDELSPRRVGDFSAVVFGAGDFRTPTEHRVAPPPLRQGDALCLGSLRATIVALLDHPRLVKLHFEAPAIDVWNGLARHGRPIQYAHLSAPLDIWDTWTPIAAAPAAFEPPSAGFLLDWRTLAAMRSRGVRFATLTHAAGISSTGDLRLDARLPFDEPYRIPASTAAAIAATRVRGGRIIAIGTSVVRALEHAAAAGGIVRPGEGIARQRIGAQSALQIVDAIVSGTHARGTSHYELLRAFLDEATLDAIDEQLETHGYRTHEFGDSVFVEKARVRAALSAA
jgi:S-adenosylmethionine:tRNA ribosyltransferase-isomerase